MQKGEAMELTHNLYTTDRTVTVTTPRRSTTRTIHPEAWDEALYVLPANWEELSTDEAAAVALEERHAGITERIAQYEQRTEVLDRPTPRKPNAVPAELKGDYLPLNGMPTVATHKVDRNHLWPEAGFGCPCCGDVIREEAWGPSDDTLWCLSCGYNPEISLDVDPTLPSTPRPACFGRKGMTPYRNDELAASQVIYHEGEPVMPEVAAVTVDAYPPAWDKALTDTVVKPESQELRRQQARPVMERLVRFAQRVLAAELDATLV